MAMIPRVETFGRHKVAAVSRCDQITGSLNMIAGAAHSYGKTMAASPFPTPKMASRMVRQDWAKMEPGYCFSDGLPGLSIRKMSVLFPIVPLENVRDKNDKTVLYCGHDRYRWSGNVRMYGCRAE